MSANQRKLSFIEKVFSVRNEGVRKVICILGIRIKFRTLRLVIRELDNRLEKLDQVDRELTERFNSQIKDLKEISKEQSARIESLIGTDDELVKRLVNQEQGYKQLRTALQKLIESQRKKNSEFDLRLVKNEQANKELGGRLGSELEQLKEISSEHDVRLEALAGTSHELSSRLDRQNTELKAVLQKQIERQEQKNTDFDRRLDTSEQANKELRVCLDKEQKRQEEISSEHGVRIEALAGTSNELSSRLDRQNTELNAGLQKHIDDQGRINNELAGRIENLLRAQDQTNSELIIRLEKHDLTNKAQNARVEQLFDDQLKINNELCNRMDNQEQASKELNARVEKYDQLSNELSGRFEKQEQNYKRELNSKYRQLMYRIHEYCPDEKRPLALKDWFYEHTGEPLNLDNPRTYNEKIQWLKLHDSTPVKTRLADKYMVRDWIKGKIGDEYLIPLLGVWDSFDEIDFDKLPDRFVLKCNHGSGYNIIVKDKTKLDKSAVRKKISSWMNEDFAFRNGFELHYSAIPRKIIAEKYIECNGKDIHDYKLWCFGGKVEYIEFLPDGYIGGKSKDAFYSRDWQKQNFVNSHVADDAVLKKPDNLDLLIRLAEKLAFGFSHVRVDFYDVNNRIYFAEMTFTSSSGIDVWVPKEKNLELGNMIRLPEQTS